MRNMGKNIEEISSLVNGYVMVNGIGADTSEPPYAGPMPKNAAYNLVVSCEDEKYGARSLLAPSSTAMTLIPAKNSVMYRYSLFFSIGGREITSPASVSLLFILFSDYISVSF